MTFTCFYVAGERNFMFVPLACQLIRSARNIKTACTQMRKKYQPMLAKEIEKPFSSKDWIFEIKWDGFRAIAYVNDNVNLISRNDIDLIRNFPEFQELKRLTHNVVLDGEIVIIKDGKNSFQAVQERGKAVKTSDSENERVKSPAEYIVFDILKKMENHSSIFR